MSNSRVCLSDTVIQEGFLEKETCALRLEANENLQSKPTEGSEAEGASEMGKMVAIVYRVTSCYTPAPDTPSHLTPEHCEEGTFFSRK